MVVHESRELSKVQWLPFFDSISKGLRGKGVDITISSFISDTHQSRLWQLHGLTYDPHDDALIVSCRKQEHVISSPINVRIERDGLAINLIEITKRDGERELLRFIDPLLLPAA
jgi:hypothetical protein